ncbi:unnamed protein product [Chrysoparadoxa australica]
MSRRPSRSFFTWSISMCAALSSLWCCGSRATLPFKPTSISLNFFRVPYQNARAGVMVAAASRHSGARCTGTRRRRLGHSVWTGKARWSSQSSVLLESSSMSCDQSGSADEGRAWPEELRSCLKDEGELTVGQIINAAAEWLGLYNVIDPKASAAELLAKALGYRGAKELLQAHSRQSQLPLSNSQAAYFQDLCQQRSRHVPVQYLMGEWDWHEISLLVRPPVLIMRPETEELVEMVLADIKAKGLENKPLSMLDVGAGTGAIGLALLNKLPKLMCTACDISPEAVALASENAIKVGVSDRYSCHLGSIESPDTLGSSTTFDLIVSNPPYIPKPDMKGLSSDVVNYEDWNALCGGADGLDVVNLIIERAPALLSQGGVRKLWMEVDSSHPELLEKRLSTPQVLDMPRQPEFEWWNDLGQLPRFVCISFAP